MNKKKDRKAAALRYAPETDKSPKVVAKGRGHIADKIIALARENGVPVREDPELLEMLATIELRDEIPPDLYKAVAEVLTFIYRLHQSPR